MAIRDAVTRVITPQQSKVWHKLALVAATLVLPVTALNWLLLSAYREQITFAKQEVAGEVYLQPVRRLTEHLIEHRALANEVILGDASARKDLLAKQVEIDEDVRVLGALDQEVGDSLGARKPWAAIRAAWPELRKKAATLTAERSLALHNALVGDVLGLVAAVADASNLRFDPIPVGFYLSDTMTDRIPAEADCLGRIRDLAVAAAAAKRVGPAERAALLELIGRRAPDARAIDDNMKGVFRGFAQFEAQLKGTTTEHLTAGEDLVEAVRRDVLGAGDEMKVSPEELAALGNRAVATGFRLYDEAAPGLNLLLKGRIDEARRRILVGALCSVVGILLTLLIGLQISRGITRQVRSIIALLGQIGIGNFEARANITSTDELGDIASSLNSMLDSTLVLVQSRAERDNIQASIMKLLDEVSGVAEGDLTREAEVTEDVTGAIADSFNYMILQLRQIISDVQDATLQVGTSANEIHGNTERLVLNSQVQAEKIFDTSTAIEEIALSIQQVSDNAAESATVAQQALANATQGNEAVQNTIQGMTRIRDQAQETAKRIKRLGESSQEIGQIIQLIDDIADRTSILALNASIQAAAAGEAGRGFAVVAEEVERLAERSTDATKKIATLIKTIQSETNEAVGSMEKSIHEVVEGSKLANQAGQALGEIGSVSSRLAQLIQSISQASRQQARGSEAVAKAMGEISEITQDTTEGTRQAAEAVSLLAGLADALRSSVSTFRLPGRSWQPDEDETPIGTNGFGHEANGHDLAERINARSGEFRRVPAHV